MSNPAESPRTLVVERVFPHPPEKIWRALTEKSLLAQWMMKNDFEPVAGHKFNFQSNPVPNWDGVIACEVQVVDPLKKLSYTWSTMGMDFMVLWTLTPAEGGTHLSVEQSGFRPNHPPQAYKGAQYGWTHFLNGLEKVLSGGQV